jgi:hypothetical protein
MSVRFFHGHRETWAERTARHNRDAERLAARDAEERTRFAGQPETVKKNYRQAQIVMAVCIPLWTACAVFNTRAALALAIGGGLSAAVKLKGSGFPVSFPLSPC